VRKGDRENGKFLGCGCLGWTFALVILVLLAGVALGPIGGQRLGPDSACMQTARAIGLSMFSYANDNNGNYPDGKNSTEVFRKLLDGGYISDPIIFYIPMPGKTKPIPGQKLKPENVSFDITSGANSNSPEGLPIVFLTGYKVTYSPGGAAVPIIKPYPPIGMEERNQTWFDWLMGRPSIRYSEVGGMAVAYKNNSAKFMNFETAPDGSGSVPNFVPPDFKPDGRTYRQLTPDGSLP
jgi:hypothetical protein